MNGMILSPRESDEDEVLDRWEPAGGNFWKWALVAIVLLAIAMYLVWPTPLGSFNIQPGENLLDHVEYSEAIDLAEANNLPVTATPLGGSSSDITYSAARSLAGSTDKVRVVIMVQPGDHVDRDTRVLTPAR